MFQGKRFEDIVVGDAFEIVEKGAVMVQKGARIGEVIDALIGQSGSEAVYVIDVEGNLAGAIRTQTLLRAVGYRVGVRESTGLSFLRMLRDMRKESAESLMAKVRPVKRSTPLKKALDLMIEDGVEDLPVVDDDYKLVGHLSALELFYVAEGLFDK